MLPDSHLTRKDGGMAKRIFDQDQPRSVLARRLNEAFAGCEKWTVAPPRERRLADAPIPETKLGRLPVPSQQYF